MIVRFDETFKLPIEEVYSYFESPKEWVRLYGIAGQVKDHGDGWWGIPLDSFPFPLVARNTISESSRVARWEFRGFWKGYGEVHFKETGEGVKVEGQEEISVRWLFFLSPIVEKLFLFNSFSSIWKFGWRRLRKLEPQAEKPSP